MKKIDPLKLNGTPGIVLVILIIVIFITFESLARSQISVIH